MVVVRLARGGNRNRPYFHVVVADSRARLQGRFIERLGFYNPIANDKVEAFRIDHERLNYWVGVGAKLSDSVQNLVKNNKKSA